MSKRVTLVYNILGDVSDEEAVEQAIDAVESGRALSWFVQDLPDLGAGRWVEL